MKLNYCLLVLLMMVLTNFAHAQNPPSKLGVAPIVTPLATPAPVAMAAPAESVEVKKSASDDPAKFFVGGTLGFAAVNDLDAQIGVQFGYRVLDRLTLWTELNHSSSLFASDYGDHDNILAVGVSAKYR